MTKVQEMKGLYGLMFYTKSFCSVHKFLVKDILRCCSLMVRAAAVKRPFVAGVCRYKGLWSDTTFVFNSFIILFIHVHSVDLRDYIQDQFEIPR